MWSEKYAFFHHILNGTMVEADLKLEPIFIEQSYFDKALHTKEGEHAWSGCSLKIDLLLDQLKKASSPYILFTDVDLIVKPGIHEKLVPFMESETSMVFLKEGEHLNIGFILLKVCPEVISFWELVKAKMIEEPKHDQTYVNDLIGGYPGTWATFDNQTFACSNTWNGKSAFVVMQPLTSNLGKEMDFAEKIFYSAQYMDVQPYMQYVHPDVIPFIYKFQEILMEAQKAMRPASRS